MTGARPLPGGMSRGAPVLRDATSRGIAAPGLLTCRHLEVVGGDPAFATAMVDRLRRHGVAAVAAHEVSPRADAVVFAGGLAIPADASAAIAINRAGFRAARQLARNTLDQRALFVALQDLGGSLGLEGAPAPSAWAGGLCGLVKTLAQEWPDGCARVIDLACDGLALEVRVELLTSELLCGGGDREVALSAGGRRRIIVHEPAAYAEPASTPPITEGAPIVVSGGARGITGLMVRELARFKPRLALLGATTLVEDPPGLRDARDDAALRRALLERGGSRDARALADQARAIRASREIRATLAACAAAGADVTYVAVDVRRGDEVSRAVAQLRAAWGPIKGIVHGAGVLADRRIAEITDEDFDLVFDTKVEGLRNLLAAAEPDPLELLVVFSSIAGRLGNAGQSVYAMANEVLAKVACAEGHRREGCLVRALDWGPWDGGMVTPGLARLFGKLGVAVIDPGSGAGLLVDELSSREVAHEVIVVAGALPAADVAMRPATPAPTPPPPRAILRAPVPPPAMGPRAGELLLPPPNVTPALLAVGRSRRAVAARSDRRPMVASTHPFLEVHRAFVETHLGLHATFLHEQHTVLRRIRARATSAGTRPATRPVELLDRAALHALISRDAPVEWWSGSIGPAASSARIAGPLVELATTIDRDAWYVDDDAACFGTLCDPSLALHLALGNRGVPVERIVLDELVIEHAGDRPRHGRTVVLRLEVTGVHVLEPGVTAVDFRSACTADGEHWSRAHGRALAITGAHEREAGALPATAASPIAIPAGSLPRFELTSERLRALAGGDIVAGFGAAFRRTATHTLTPRLPAAPLLLLERTLAFDAGDATRAPVLRFTVALAPERWYATGGAVAQAWCLEATRQGACLLLIALGFTLDRDGWRFEPAAGGRIRLRGGARAAPTAGELVFELVVTSLVDHGNPTIVVDADARLDSRVIFRARGVGVSLVRDWPLSRRPRPHNPVDDRGAAIAELDGVRFDYATMLAGALGRPRDVFGSGGRAFEAPGRKMPRLPGPPYHFVSRIVRVAGEKHAMQAGAVVVTEYDVPPQAWYFDDSSSGVMPFCVLLEVALQPCGWLSVYAGCPQATDTSIFFRNLDCDGELLGEVTRAAGTIRVKAELTRLSYVSGIMLVAYEVTCRVGDRVIARLRPGFGYFPREALAAQVGLPPSDAERRLFAADPNLDVDLTCRPTRYFDGPLHLPGAMLLMVDRITGYWPHGGSAGLGRVRGEKLIDPGAWYFKAHFFEDPVQPGSLGLEMVLQLLQFAVLHEGLADDLATPRWEPIAPAERTAWKLRGQITHDTRRATAEVEIVERKRDATGLTVLASAWLWADDIRVYEIKRIGLRVSADGATVPAPSRIRDEVLDPATDSWVADHRPNFTIPVVPLMSIVDRLAAAALRYGGEAYPGGDHPWVVVGIDEAHVKTWLTCARPMVVRTEVFPDDARAETAVDRVTLRVELHADRDERGRFLLIATGVVRLARAYAPPPPAWPRLADATAGPDVYASGALFHGPAFHLVREVAYGARGSSTVIDPGAGTVPFGCLNQALLDAALHGIPHDELGRWSAEIPPQQTAFPSRVQLDVYGPPPVAGRLRCETRLVGFRGATILPIFELQIIGEDDRPWLAMRLVEVLVPVGSHGHRRRERIAFLRDRVFMPGVGLSTFTGERTELAFEEVQKMDWLRGSVAYAYGIAGAPADVQALARQVAIKDHVAQRVGAHPATIELLSDGASARDPRTPEIVHAVRVEQAPDRVIVCDAGGGA